ncbi:SgcJ/EcaC family oxidoreductase [Saccharomonospora halophila]|uniref:SgcJ/EcaC family oxidoreductase n=1 Tax=Saccharomonospora halophila TaxID=129922 RepID=UPI00037650AF|nr:SgcJ/EcaC family oxidoreductase [Saccharomonospora halophila]
MDTEAPDLRPSESDDRTIRRVVSRAQDAQRDTDALMRLHTPDTVIVNIAGRRVLGRDDFAAAMTAALSSSLEQVRTELDVLDIRLATPDVALVSCTKTVHDGRNHADSTTVLPATGTLTYVLVRDQGTWRIALAQTTPVATTGT